VAAPVLTNFTLRPRKWTSRSS